MKKKRVHVVVSGIVQGVGFRFSAKYMAQRLGVTGWVMNTPDGKVEAVVEGEECAVDEMVNWFKKGPSGAVVEDAKIKEEKYIGEFNSFDIKFGRYYW